jgi:hypothetical protein
VDERLKTLAMTTIRNHECSIEETSLAKHTPDP